MDLHHHLHPHPLPSPVSSSSSRPAPPYLWRLHTPLLATATATTTTTASAIAASSMKQLGSIATSSPLHRLRLFGNIVALPPLRDEEAEEEEEEKAVEGNNFVSLQSISHVTIAALVTGLLSCPYAWADTEVATLQEVGNWINDIDAIKNGFISALLASRKSNVAVFVGTFGALVAMTFISVFLGRTFHYLDGILPLSFGENELPVDDLAAAVLLLYFGASTLLDAASMEGSKAEEEQQEAELAVAGIGANGKGSAIASTVVATFALVFVAEWGDKSFFSTIALSAASSPFGVVSGAVVGHGVATLLAVLGGSFLSTYISEKVIAYIGGVLFLVFAAFTLFETFS